MSQQSQSSPSSVTVNLSSVDAMFATIIAEQQATKEALLLRLTNQDAKLDRIETQTTLTNGRVSKLERTERDRKVRKATIILIAGSSGGVLAMLAHKLFPAFFA